MPEDADQLLAQLRARLTQDQFREWLRASHAALDQAAADAAVEAHLDRVAAQHSGRA